MSRQKKSRYSFVFFRKILKLMDEKRFEEAIIDFHEYIKTYPKDIESYIYCATCYMALGDFQSAEKLLNRVVFGDKTLEKEKEMYNMVKINLLGLQGKYDECLILLKENIDSYKKNGWGYTGALIYLKKKLNILKECDYERANEKYLLRQIISYNEEEAISHIERHAEFDGNDNELKFLDNFPIRDIYQKLRNEYILKNENKIYNDIMCDNHVFKYDYNGHVGSKLVDYFLVVTLKDTNEIITMYPYENKERRECIDLTPIVKEVPKVKRLSQIDKFNQRYSKK